MSRIKKRGLDYFPMNTDFIHDRLVRRIMKREGDASLSVLIQTLCCIYSGEGYYVAADALFYDDLADNLYQQEPADVERIIRLAVEYGFFDARLFGEYGILTSVDIQRQFFFITKRRAASLLDERYNLLPKDASAEGSGSDGAADTAKEAAKDVVPAAGDVCDNAGIATEKGITATFQAENVENGAFGTQSIQKQSIQKQSTSKQSTENPLLQSSPETGGTEGAAGTSAEEYLRKIESLTLPRDGLKRNFDGLLFNLRQLRIPPHEQYAILLKSNFGVIGHPLWRGFFALRESHGKIRQPGRYLLSLCK